ncbi:MAG: hypothetical protein V7L25_24075 [Nostoc sp.]
MINLLGTCTERSRKACGIATLRAQPKKRSIGHRAWGNGTKLIKFRRIFVPENRTNINLKTEVTEKTI